jgi:transcriptional regulator GlxA family with amidase domain
LFRRFEHCTPGNYLTRLRVERAEHLLREGTLNILETSLECGFGSVSNFYKQFKLRTGTTPGQVRWKPRAGR